jgi:hypothetical protein
MYDQTDALVPLVRGARKSKSNLEAMMIIFFDIRGIVHIDWVPDGQTINQDYYKEVLTTLCERCEEKDLTFLFLKIKPALKGTHFKSVDAVKAKK